MVQNIAIVEKTSSETKFDEFLMEIKKSKFEKESLYCFLTMHTPFRNLVNVTLQECKFNFLPKEFGTLHHLQEITLSRNYVVNTTQSAWEWLEQAPMRSNLKLLKITEYYLSELPLQITCLKNLTTLDITGNRINFLPKEFGNLSLLDLDLSCNDFGRSKQSAWEWLTQAPIRNNLRKLDISCNYITAVPLQITCLKNLESLGLFKNQINFLPKEFGILSQLTTLDLEGNKFVTCGHSTWKWLEMPIRNNLSLLDISNNCLFEFPLQITCLKNLQFLDISRNKIDFLPKELGTLPQLTCLNLSFNHLGKSDRNTWEWLEQAAVRNKLSELYLSHNLLTELPPQIGKLNALTILRLAGNKLKFLPQSLVNLKNLKHLNLSDNDLLYLPGSLAHVSVDINVEENPFNLDDDSDDNLTTNL
ncbi:leucine-rich repeat and death domain-containing protein 1-like isoform X4 [Linepithema humile]|uniref:leucine-rich repeat and death domain-containing protein 1-like isoform X4 n=1 Tax=Linepithema humile TaxID=83485 RepID=UPI0006232264|nr:PREDICTED: leucine-rich repeat and death domain-containing protein 1-like [Linepithema humile]